MENIKIVAKLQNKEIAKIKNSAKHRNGQRKVQRPYLNTKVQLNTPQQSRGSNMGEKNSLNHERHDIYETDAFSETRKQKANVFRINDCSHQYSTYHASTGEQVLF